MKEPVKEPGAHEYEMTRVEKLRCGVAGLIIAGAVVIWFGAVVVFGLEVLQWLKTAAWQTITLQDEMVDMFGPQATWIWRTEYLGVNKIIDWLLAGPLWLWLAVLGVAVMFGGVMCEPPGKL
jgi:hypothetical protein